MKPEVIERVREFMERQIPFNAYLGMQATVLEPRHARLAIPFRPELVGDPFRPALHGGVISALVDTAGGAAMFLSIPLSDRVSTVDLRVDYLRPAGLDLLVADAEVIRLGNRIGVARVKVFSGAACEPELQVAEGVAVYSIKRG
jgi:uncharacterized protein (TIGR00369 family)